MSKLERIEPQEAHDRADKGALIVCAYDDREKCREQVPVAGATPLPDLEERADDLPRDQELIFYCN